MAEGGASVGVTTRPNGALTERWSSEEDVGIPIQAIRQISFLRGLEHPNIARLLDVQWDAAGERLTLAYAACGVTLKEHLCSRGPLRGQRLKMVAFQCVRGVQWLHCHGIAGLCLGVRGVRIDPISDHTVISNLKLSVSCFMECSRNVTLQEPWSGCPVDALLGGEISVAAAPKMDVWSLGCLIGYMALGGALFPGRTRVDIMLQIFRVLGTPDESSWPGVSRLPHFSGRLPRWRGDGLARSMRSTLPPAGLELLESSLRYESRARPSSRCLLRHRLFDNLKYDPEVRSLVRSAVDGSPRSLASACSQRAASSYRGCLGGWLRREVLGHLGAPLCGDVEAGRAGGGFPALRSAHRLWKLHAPAVERGMRDCFKIGPEYDEHLSWCLAAYDIAGFHDRVLLRTLTVFFRAAPAVGISQISFMAAAMLAMKLSCEVESWDQTVGRWVRCLSRDTLPFESIASCEMAILTCLDGNLAMPVALDFTELLCLKAADRGSRLRRPCRELAKLLVLMSLLDGGLHFGTPHVVLAASCCLLAVFVDQGPSGACEAMLEAVAAYSESAPALHAEVLGCSRALIGLAQSSRAGRLGGSAALQFWLRASKHERQHPRLAIPTALEGFGGWLAARFRVFGPVGQPEPLGHACEKPAPSCRET